MYVAQAFLSFVTQVSNDNGETNAPATHQRHRHESQRRPHEQAVVDAEARRLAHAIGPYGVLHRDALAHIVGATHWREGGFRQASPRP